MVRRNKTHAWASWFPAVLITYVAHVAPNSYSVRQLSCLPQKDNPGGNGAGAEYGPAARGPARLARGMQTTDQTRRLPNRLGPRKFQSVCLTFSMEHRSRLA